MPLYFLSAKRELIVFLEISILFQGFIWKSGIKSLILKLEIAESYYIHLLYLIR